MTAFGRACRGRLKGCFDLLEHGHVAPLQYKTDVGMRNELAGPGNRVSVTCFSDGDGRDHVADVLEIHFGLQHADDVAGEAFDGHGDGHIRF